MESFEQEVGAARARRDQARRDQAAAEQTARQEKARQRDLARQAVKALLPYGNETFVWVEPAHGLRTLTAPYKGRDGRLYRKIEVWRCWCLNRQTGAAPVLLLSDGRLGEVDGLQLDHRESTGHGDYVSLFPPLSSGSLMPELEAETPEGTAALRRRLADLVAEYEDEPHRPTR